MQNIDVWLSMEFKTILVFKTAYHPTAGSRASFNEKCVGSNSWSISCDSFGFSSCIQVDGELNIQREGVFWIVQVPSSLFLQNSSEELVADNEQWSHGGLYNSLKNAPGAIK